jgi:hypothetical protein
VLLKQPCNILYRPREGEDNIEVVVIFTQCHFVGIAR